MDCQAFFDRLNSFCTVRAVKLYRLQPEATPQVPTIPCLDHEAMLHEGIASHAAAYIEDHSGSLHEVVIFPGEHLLNVDIVSTMGECTAESHENLLNTLRTRFPGHRIRVTGASWLRGDLRVAKACRAQVTLREVLTGDNLDQTKSAVDRLHTISSLMEKESRVASWGARTVMTPLLAVAGFLTYQIAGTFVPRRIGLGRVHPACHYRHPRRRLPLLRSQSRAPYADGQPRLEARRRVRFDSH